MGADPSEGGRVIARAALLPPDNTAAYEAAREVVASTLHEIELPALTELWMRAADEGAPDESLELLEDALAWSQPGSRLAERAELYLDDLVQLRARLAADEAAGDLPLDSAPDVETTEIGDADLRSALASPDLASERLDVLEDSLDRPGYSEEWAEALAELSLYRGDEVIELLLPASEVPDPGQRQQALQALWISAADGDASKRDRVRERMQRALDDADVRVVALAQNALADLERLGDPQSSRAAPIDPPGRGPRGALPRFSR